MDILHSLYDIVSGLGSFLLIPVFFFLLGLASRAGVQRSGQCALAVLGSTVAIQLLISTLGGQLVTLVNTMIDTYSLSTGAANLHWQKAAEVTLNSDILYWVLPGAVLLNLLMLACRVTRVLNLDLWSLWQTAFAGVLVQQLTGEMWYGLAAALLYCSLILLNKRLRGLDTLETTFCQLCTAALVMLPYVLLGGHLHGLAPAPSTLFLLLVVGIVHTGLVYILFFSAVGRLPAQTTAVLSYVDPVTAILLATLFLHQPFGLAEACGTVLILGATLANELPGNRTAEAQS